MIIWKSQCTQPSKNWLSLSLSLFRLKFFSCSKLKQYRNNQCGSVSTGLSVRKLGACASPPSQRPTTTDTHNLIWKPQLRSYVTGRLGIKRVPRRPLRFGSSLGFRMDVTYAHNQISKPQLRSNVTGRLGIKGIPRTPVRFGSYSAFSPAPAASFRLAAGGFQTLLGFQTGWT